MMRPGVLAHDTKAQPFVERLRSGVSDRYIEHTALLPFLTGKRNLVPQQGSSNALALHGFSHSQLGDIFHVAIGKWHNGFQLRSALDHRPHLKQTIEAKHLQAKLPLQHLALQTAVKCANANRALIDNSHGVVSVAKHALTCSKHPPQEIVRGFDMLREDILELRWP